MKKIILTSASLIALSVASPALAQSESTITQVGNGNDADVTQTGANVSTITQGTDLLPSDNNVATVDQENDDNTAGITQTATGSNTAFVTQEGSGTNLNDVNIGAFAFIDQIGTSDGNTATIEQTAGAVDANGQVTQSDSLGSTATVNQGAGIGNEAFVSQGDTGPFFFLSLTAGGVSGADGATAIINQENDGNFASIIQGGIDQDAEVTQIGSTNLALIEQGALSGEASIATVEQFADGGEIRIAQNSIGNDADVVQFAGSNNTVTVSQGEEGTGDDNIVEIGQAGFNNTATVTQNELTSGSLNDVILLQDGTGNTSTVTQEGSSNFADVAQFDGSTSVVTQTGDNNIANVTQGIDPNL